jgi:hypothetical protein
MRLEATMLSESGKIISGEEIGERDYNSLKMDTNTASETLDLVRILCS